MARGVGRVVGGPFVAALFATILVLGGALILLLGLVALGHALLGGDTPVPFAAAVLALGASCAGLGWLLGRAVRRA